MASQELDQAGKRAEFDRLMTAATVYRRRDDYAQATQAIKRALAIFPEDIGAREFAADMIYAHGNVEKASEHYKAILEAEPGRASAEAKYAKAILELAEADRQRELMKMMIENPGKFRTGQARSANLAVFISVIAPGFGHIYCGQYNRGMAIFGGWLLACVLFVLGLDPSANGVNKVTVTSVSLLCVAASLHIYALLSAAQQADKTKSGKDHRNASEPE